MYSSCCCCCCMVDCSPALVTHRLWWGYICSACFILGSGTNHTQMQKLPMCLPILWAFVCCIFHCTTKESQSAFIWEHELFEALDTNKTRDCFGRFFLSYFITNVLLEALMCAECCSTSNVVWISCSGRVEGLATHFFFVKPFILCLFI